MTVVCLLAGVRAYGGHCTLDQPLQWIINPTYVDRTTTSAITGDGSPYVDGQSGVAAVINVCSGSGDATLVVSRGRTMAFSFAYLLASNSATPAWATGTVSALSMNVRNIAFVPTTTPPTPPLTRSDEYSFTTRFGSSVYEPSGKTLANFGMLNPSPTAMQISPESNANIANFPNDDSLVNVYHCPAGDTSTACMNLSSNQPIEHETWFVYPDSSQTPVNTNPNPQPTSSLTA